MTNSTTMTSAAQAALDDVLTAFGADAAFSGLPPDSASVHKAVLRLYAERGHPPVELDLAALTGLVEARVNVALRDLASRDLVVLDAGRIVGAYPFTERDTGISVRCGGDPVHAMCAVDALGTGAMLDRDSEIDASCVHCSAPISVTTRSGGTQLGEALPDGAAVWVGIRKDEGPAATSLCTVIRFACSRTHLERWRETQPPMTGHLLSIGDGLAVGRGIFGDLLREERGATND